MATKSTKPHIQLKKVVIDYIALNIGLKYVGMYLFLLNHKDKLTNICEVTLEELAEEYGCDTRSIKRKIKALSDSGVIVKTKKGVNIHYLFPFEDYYIKKNKLPQVIQDFYNDPETKKRNGFVKAFHEVFTSIKDKDLLGMYYRLLSLQDYNTKVWSNTFTYVTNGSGLSRQGAVNQMEKLKDEGFIIMLKGSEKRKGNRKTVELKFLKEPEEITNTEAQLQIKKQVKKKYKEVDKNEQNKNE